MKDSKRKSFLTGATVGLTAIFGMAALGAGGVAVFGFFQVSGGDMTMSEFYDNIKNVSMITGGIATGMTAILGVMEAENDVAGWGATSVALLTLAG